MPYRPPSPCTQPGCGILVYGGSRCPDHLAQDRRYSERRRATAPQRGYDDTHRYKFRARVLRRDPYCRCDETGHEHGERPCRNASTVADHWPVDRRTLAASGQDPNDPRHGRGLCVPCDTRQTARRQPGGWAARRRRMRELRDAEER